MRVHLLLRPNHHSRAWLACLVAGLLAACTKAPPAEEPVRAVRTMTVQTAGAVTQHEYPAEIRARTEVRLGFRVGGKLVRRAVDLGDTVRAGQALAQLDASDLKLGQDAARAALSAASASLAQNEAEFKRYKELRDQGFISGMELDRREAALKAARAQADQARAQVSVQTNQAGYAQLVADAAGVVTAVDAEPGAVLAAGSPVLRLALDGPRDAVFSVPEDRVAALRALLGRPGAVRIRLWGAPDSAGQPATVREVAAAADPATRTFLVKADMGATAVRLGQTASVLIDTPLPTGVIKLPLPAVFEQGGQSVVWLVDKASMTVKARPIGIGGAEGNLVLVAGGLAPGEVVVTAGVHVLTPGQKVRWYQEPGAGTVAANAAPPAAAPPSTGSPGSPPGSPASPTAPSPTAPAPTAPASTVPKTVVTPASASPVANPR